MAIEPKYTPLERLQALILENKLEDIGQILEGQHIRLRNAIGPILGDIELAYHRGRQAGKDEERKGLFPDPEDRADLRNRPAVAVNVAARLWKELAEASEALLEKYRGGAEIGDNRRALSYRVVRAKKGLEERGLR